MKKVNIVRTELLKVVRSNRETHVSEYAEASANYRDKVLEALDERRADIRNGGKIDTYFQLPEPQDHTEEYDRVIRMLEMSSDETIELDAHEFDMYVRDSWAWSHAAKLINASYTSRR